MATQAKIRRRREKVYQLVLQGAKQIEIADQLQLTEKTINKDVKSIKKDLSEKLTGVDIKEVYVEFAESMRLRIRKLWVILSDDKIKVRDRMNAINLLREEDKEAVKRAQIIGLLPKTLPEEGMGGTQINNQQINVFQILMEIKEKEKSQVINNGPEVIEQTNN